MTHTAETANRPAGFPAEDIPGGDRDLIGLARVSTDGQDAQLQADDLRAAGCGRIYQEKASTRKATADRPGLSAALDYLRAGDTLVVWKLDRLGRSVKDVLTIADDLHERGVGVRILTGKLSGTYSPGRRGQFFFTMMAAFAELERDIIHERTMAGLVAARAQGRRGGRPVVMDADKLAAARARRERGESPPRSPRPSASAAPRSTVTWEPTPQTRRTEPGLLPHLAVESSAWPVRSPPCTPASCPARGGERRMLRLATTGLRPLRTDLLRILAPTSSQAKTMLQVPADREPGAPS